MPATMRARSPTRPGPYPTRLRSSKNSTDASTRNVNTAQKNDDLSSTDASRTNIDNAQKNDDLSSIDASSRNVDTAQKNDDLSSTDSSTMDDDPIQLRNQVRQLQEANQTLQQLYQRDLTILKLGDFIWEYLFPIRLAIQNSEAYSEEGLVTFYERWIEHDDEDDEDDEVGPAEETEPSAADDPRTILVREAITKQMQFSGRRVKRKKVDAEFRRVRELTSFYTERVRLAHSIDPKAGRHKRWRTVVDAWNLVKKDGGAVFQGRAEKRAVKTALRKYQKRKFVEIDGIVREKKYPFPRVDED